MNRFPVPRCFVLCAVTALAWGNALAATAADQAEQLRIIGVMTENMRARIDQLTVLLPPEHPLAEVEEKTVTLNHNAVVVEGQRFDGIVVTAPAEKGSFAWAFAVPPNVASWYILRAQGEMKGFANFLSRPRGSLPAAATMKPTDVSTITLQKLDSASWSAHERYVLWFRFKDDTPTEMTLRAGFFAAASLHNNGLPALLFPAIE